MMLTVEAYLRQGKRELRRLALDPRVQRGAKFAGWAAGGLVLSGANLQGFPIPLAMGALCAVTGWRALVMGLGAIGGSWLFWESAQGILWAVLGTFLALFLGKRQETQDFPLVLPAAAALVISATGLVFQILGQEDVPLRIYLLRIGIAALSAGLSRQILSRRDALTDWVAGGVAVFAAASVSILPGVGLGYLAAGAMAVSCPFPAAALAGLGLDLARVTGVPMGVSICAAWFGRLLPPGQRWVRCLAPGISYLAVSFLWGIWDWMPLPGLVLGGAVGYLLPPRMDVYHRRGDVGLAQVRLETVAGTLSYTQQLLLESAPPPIDEKAILWKVRDRACASCSARSACLDQERLTVEMLHHPLDFTCRKTGRILGELRRGQEQLRSLKAQRQQQREYRIALTQQYQFLAEQIRRLSDQLAHRGERTSVRYRIEVSARGRAREHTNGDRCMAFQGIGCRYYILLCDGMGTGLGAAQEGDTVANLLRQLLVSGFPPEQAFQSINSLLILRDRAGAVTLDLAEIRLDTGRAALYKWGAAPSYILRRAGPEKLGKGGPPPGISLGDQRESVTRLSLHRGETLIMASDGAQVASVLPRMPNAADLHIPDLAAKLADLCRNPEDDATVAVFRLRPLGESP